MARPSGCAIVVPLLVAACGSLDPPGGAVPAGRCADLYDEDRLVDYRVEIADGEWAALQDEFANWAEREANGLPLKPYHPILFRYVGPDGEEEVVPDARMRLKGNPCCSWSGKMQFVISFNEVDSDARFHGLRKIALDAPPYDPSLLKDRLALDLFREVGLPAACANSATLTLNGSLYGVFTNIEFLDKEFLQRNFPGQAGGDLWKYGTDLKTNEQTSDGVRIEQFWQANDVAAIDALADLEGAVLEWAAEATLPDADGYWSAGHNFYLYDHPQRGFLFVPWDKDGTFDWMPADADPYGVVYYDEYGEELSGLPPHQVAVLADPVWRQRFVDAVAAVRAVYNPAAIDEKIGRFAAQIEAAVESDPNYPFTLDEFHAAHDSIRAATAARAAFLDGWLDAR